MCCTKIFKIVFNGFEKPHGKEFNGTIIDKILGVGYVLFTLFGCLTLLIALCVLANAGLGPLFFIFLGIGSSLLGIVVIGTIVLGAIVRKDMFPEKIYFYLDTESKSSDILAANGGCKSLFTEINKYQPYDVKNIDTRNLIIPRSRVYNQENLQRDLSDLN